MNLYGDQEKVIAGQVWGLHSDTETRLAGERIYPGDPVFAAVGDDKVGYLPHITAVALAISALVEGNVINLTVNGVNIGPIAWDTDAATTVRRAAEAVDQNESIRALGIDAFQIDGSPLAFYLQSPGVSIAVSGSITGGASQGTVSSTAYTTTKFVGVARREELCFKEGAGFYPPQYPVNVLTRGKVAVFVADSAKPGDLKPAYIITSGADAGKFTDASSGNYDSGCLFRSGFLESGLAVVEVRGAR
jgi:hypothetical protein